MTGLECRVAIQEEEVPIDELLAEARRGGVGGIVLFDGIVRDDDCEAMEVEAYTDVALAELQRIATDVGVRHGVVYVAVIHRTGRIPVGNDLLVIVVAAAHREQAFAACREILEAIKAGVPIWKKECATGNDRWVRGEHWPVTGD
ncbi:MAG TPA: molybdenum cofactor biosynthesis protein MoaE [Methanoregulaceae archaeon]|nr:molybdenum cofactor biosynthesis protein MoaE [Methanoregulaceae archaeon]